MIICTYCCSVCGLHILLVIDIPFYRNDKAERRQVEISHRDTAGNLNGFAQTSHNSSFSGSFDHDFFDDEYIPPENSGFQTASLYYQTVPSHYHSQPR